MRPSYTNKPTQNLRLDGFEGGLAYGPTAEQSSVFLTKEDLADQLTLAPAKTKDKESLS